MEIVPPKNQPQNQPAYQKPGDSAYPAPTAGPPADRPPLADPPKKTDNGRFRSLASTVGLLLSAFLIAILLNTFVIQSYQVDGESMEPTLQNDDRLIVNKIPRTISRIDGHQYVPKRGDIIIFNQAGLPGFIGEKQLVKRVIGLPGEHVVITGTKTTIYSGSHPEGFNPDSSGSYRPALGQSCGNADITLQKDQVFVMGDNRGNSEDSRCFGPITTDQVVAKLVLRILPLNKTQSF